MYSSLRPANAVMAFNSGCPLHISVFPFIHSPSLQPSVVLQDSTQPRPFPCTNSTAYTPDSPSRWGERRLLNFSLRFSLADFLYIISSVLVVERSRDTHNKKTTRDLMMALNNRLQEGCRILEKSLHLLQYIILCRMKNIWTWTAPFKNNWLLWSNWGDSAELNIKHSQQHTEGLIIESNKFFN